MKPYQPSSGFVNALHATFWLLMFVVFPLAVNPYAFYSPAEAYVLLPKAFVLTATCILGIVTLILTYPNASFVSFFQGLRQQPLTVQAWLAFCVFLLLDAFLVPRDLALNLIGSGRRVDGFLVQAAWYALVPIAAGLVYARGNSKQIRVLLLVGAVLSALWALAQSYGFEPAEQFFSEYIRTTFDPNPDNIAYGPLALTGLTAAYLAVVSTVFLAYVTRFRLLMGLGIGVLVTAVVATGNRTAPAALALAGVFLLVYSLTRRHFRRVRTLLLYGVVGLAVLGAWQMTRSAPLEQLERTTNFVQGTDSSFRVRVIFWRAALRGLFDRPFTGYGPNGFSPVFWQHTTEEEQLYIVRTRLPEDATDIRFTGSPIVIYSLPEQEEAIFTTFGIDKAHNYLLDLTIANGFLGTGLFATAVIAGLWLMFRATNRFSKAIALGSCVYLLFGITWFATLQVDPIVWGLFGVGIGDAWRERHGVQGVQTAEASRPS